VLVNVRRLLAVAAAAALLGALFFSISPVLPAEWVPWRATESSTLPAAPLPTRPESAPNRIPGWAWALHAWHSTPAAQRDERPRGAPARVPAWYWEWRAWRLAVSG
jgi:hypothetical protein